MNWRWSHVALISLLFMLAGTGVALGLWQLERREWKHALIEAVETRAFAKPVMAPGPDGWSKLTADNDAYRRIFVNGTFDHERSTLVRAVTDMGSGYWVLAPLVGDQFTVLVNRGFVPQDKKNDATRIAGNTKGVVQVVGLLRFTEPGGGFLRENVPQEDLWYSRDVAAIAQSRQLGTIAPYFIDADKGPNLGGYPVGGLTVLKFSDNHLVYAATWFALAIGCIWSAVVVMRRQ